MKTQALQFSDFVEKIYSLHLDDKMELKNLLEQNISEEIRAEMAGNYKESQEEFHKGKLQFSSSIDELKMQL